MGTHRTFEHLQQSYFLGTTREIVDRIRDLEAAGIQDLVLATCDYDLEQLERFATEIVGTMQGAGVPGAITAPRRDAAAASAPEIRGEHVRVREEIGGGPRDRDLAVHEDVGALGEGGGHADVLLDEQDA